jgi:hypothetical protein
VLQKMKLPTLSNVEAIILGAGALIGVYVAYRLYSASSDASDAIANSSFGKGVGSIVDSVKKAFEPSVDSTSPRAVENDLDSEIKRLLNRAPAPTPFNPDPATAAANEWYNGEQFNRSIIESNKRVNLDDQLFNGELTPAGM